MGCRFSAARRNKKKISFLKEKRAHGDFRINIVFRQNCFCGRDFFEGVKRYAKAAARAFLRFCGGWKGGTGLFGGAQRIEIHTNIGIVERSVLRYDLHGCRDARNAEYGGNGLRYGVGSRIENCLCVRSGNVASV